MSFAIQALSLEYLLQNEGKLGKAVYLVPQEIDDAVSRMKLEGMGLKIDRLTEGQINYLNGWQV